MPLSCIRGWRFIKDVQFQGGVEELNKKGGSIGSLLLRASKLSYYIPPAINYAKIEKRQSEKVPAIRIFALFYLCPKDSVIVKLTTCLNEGYFFETEDLKVSHNIMNITF